MKYLKYNQEDYVASIIIDSPPANALSSHLLAELGEVFQDIESNDEVRVVLIYGEGRFFSAGADIKEFTELEKGSGFEEVAKSGQKLFEKIETFSKPVIATIHGGALGGGLELAMACHIRLVANDAKLGLPELQLGLIPGYAGTQRLPRMVGVAKAAEMILTSKPITGLEAANIGLANKALPVEELMGEALNMAKDIAKKSPITLKATIKLLNYAKTESFYEGMKKEAKLFGKVSRTNDSKEGIQAFIEKRQPKFTGN